MERERKKAKEREKKKKKKKKEGEDEEETRFQKDETKRAKAFMTYYLFKPSHITAIQRGDVVVVCLFVCLI